MSRRLFWIWIPLALNAVLYLTWRDWSLWCFRWVEWGQAEGVVRAWRSLVGGLGTPPDFVRFSLASGLWIFGVANALLWIFGAAGRGPRGRALVLGLWLACVATEGAQALGWLIGTADWSDVLAYSAGVTGAFVLAAFHALGGRSSFEAQLWERFGGRAPALHSALYVGGALLLATGAAPGTIWP